MINLDEIKSKLNEYNKRINDIESTINVDSLSVELKELEKKTEVPSFWNNPNSEIIKKISEIKNKINSFNNLKTKYDDAISLVELLEIENDEELEKGLPEIINELEKNINHLEITTLLSGKYDADNAIITFHAGAGGTESMDWVQMLYRMYTRWALNNGFHIREIYSLTGEETGFKTITAIIEGPYAYGYLKGEMGVHRLVRISPFDSNKRRHTTFASVEVLPEIEDDVDIEINPDDLRIDTYRASGAGGQHVNKTSSAVRITHMPTGIVASCQEERSQLLNKETAIKMLKSKLITLKEQENKETINDLKGIQMDIAWGSQIRSYVFCPYTMVKDHRTNYEVGNVQAVMDGDINGFIDAYLRFNK